MDGITETIQLAKKIVPVKEAYQDVVQPAARQLGRAGETLGMAINTLLLPIRKYVFEWQAKQDHLEQDLKKKLEAVPPERLVEQAPLHVVIPAVQAWSYSVDCDELRNLYSNLLANSMIMNRQIDVHPAFVEIIKQLDPYEARLFKCIAPSKDWPVYELRVKLDEKGSYAVHGTHFAVVTLDNVKTAPAPHYWQNMQRLGLINIQYDPWLSDEKAYQDLEEHEFVQSLKGQYSASNRALICAKGVMRVTPFGEKFAAICIDEPR